MRESPAFMSFYSSKSPKGKEADNWSLFGFVLHSVRRINSLFVSSTVIRPAVDVVCEDTTERGQVQRLKSVHAFQYMTVVQCSREESAVSQLLAIS